MRHLALILSLLLVAGCASSARTTAAPSVATTVNPSDLSDSAENQADYLIGPSDLLRLTVFQVPELSFNEIRVDASGNIQLPLIGSVRAAGQTPDQLSRQLENSLGARYLRNPRISLTVAESSAQKVTVDGAVAKPGVYKMQGRTTLLQAVAMAEGPTNTAQIRSVAVFRTVDSRRMVAVFDLAAIRGGQSPDPVLQGNDVVVVDTSRLSTVMREVVAALPGLAAFAYF
jgi:polysaccharide export outer membrane protein